MLRTKSQNSRLYGLFSQLAVSEDIKKELVFQFTAGRTEKSSEMEHRECNDLIITLQQQLNKLNRQKGDMLQRGRRNVFKLFHDIAFFEEAKTNSMKMKIINAWIDKKTTLNKGLNDLNFDELQKLIRQLHTVRRIYDEKKVKQAKYN